MEQFHSLGAEQALQKLQTSKKGLSGEEAKRRIEKYGYNEIKEEEKISPFMIFLEQFKSFIVIILIAATIISAWLGYHEYMTHGGSIFRHMADAIVIFIILVVNAILGFNQEYKAEKAIEALKKMTSLQAVVIRSGDEKKIDAKDLVPGDILVLATGEKIPADARLIELVNLQTQEAALTGESLPIKKRTDKLAHDMPTADMKNMIFSGTIITNGRGKAVVTATGMATEIGKIAKMIQKEKPEPTPLQKKLKVLGEYMGLGAIAICVIVFFAGILFGKPVGEMFIFAISLAVAAVPEGLPAVVTISLALGIQRMVKRNALIRKLPSVETLGATTVICTDKTGTLTMNQMTVRKIYANSKIIDVTGRGYSTVGKFMAGLRSVDSKEIEMLLKIGALCNDAELSEGEIIGDPTEGSLLVSASKAGLNYKDLNNNHPRLGEIQFSSERKRMSTYHNLDGKKTVLCKGAPDVILELCDRILVNGKIQRLTRLDKKDILKRNEDFAKDALRVLGFAFKVSEDLDEKDMIFVGLQGMIDPPRKEVKDAIKLCDTAGIRVVMITGDFKITAEAIAKELGIKGKAIDGKQLDSIKDEDLQREVGGISIYARVNPSHKMKIVDALKAKGHIVAMTGDGVNDAPALKRADIGVSMGITGTDVAKEASEMILTDDNFASIVNAVKEGRTIYDNIRKFVEYLLSSNLGEVLTVFVAILIGLPLPIVALQILWINLITDGLPALALGVEPSDPYIMKRKPRDPHENIINRSRWIYMIFIGIVMMAGTLGTFFANYKTDLVYAQTMAFSVLVFYQMFNVLNLKSDEVSLFKLGLFSNPKLIWAILISVGLHFVVIYTPLSALFNTTALAVIDWVYIIAISASVLVFGELVKLGKKYF